MGKVKNVNNVKKVFYIYGKRCSLNRVRKTKRVYSTRYSHAVTHHATDRARRCLTSLIGRETVLSTWYGRRQLYRALDEL